MPAGSVQYIIECQAKGTTGNSTAPCVTVGAVRYQPVMVQAYVADPASSSYFDAVAAPYDYAQGGALFSFAFGVVLAAWYVSKHVGVILDAVKRF